MKSQPDSTNNALLKWLAHLLFQPFYARLTRRRLRLESENWIGVNPPAMKDSENNSRIIIGGMGVMAKHACLTRGSSSALMLSCMPGARTLVNGVKLAEKVGVKVRHMDR